MNAHCIMVQGTASHVGKSVLVSALCRIFVQDGYKVAPFKAQNMSLNSFATEDGGEIGRAQAMQAEAAKIKPTVDMNPILLKPTGQMGSQVIVHGKPWTNMKPKEYYSRKSKLLKAVVDSLNRLRSQYEIIVIEGAGSPAEINLKKSDIVNMKVAKLADAPVILVGDIDRGGVFASIVGTLALLTQAERHRIKGLVINKFRGDFNLLKPGLDFIEKKTKKPMLGVLPYFTDIHIDQEDSVWFDDIKTIKTLDPERPDKLDIVVIHLPHTSNFTDFDPLVNEPDVSLRYVASKDELGHPDCIIISGTKNTIEDLIHLKNFGLFKKIQTEAESGKMVIGICGGFQMLGKEIRDPYNIESDRSSISGFGLLGAITTFGRQKSTCQAKAVPINSSATSYFDGFDGDEIISGYEIHHGKTELRGDTAPLLKIIERSGQSVNDFDGASNRDGNIWATYLHGIFDNDRFRRSFLNDLRQKKGWKPLALDISTNWNKDKEYDKLAALVRANLQMEKIYQILFERG